jgi:lysophospholipase L1-like esterase
MSVIIPPRNPLARHKLVAGRCQFMGQNTDSGGTNTQCMGQQGLNTFFPFTDPILVFTNWGVGGASGGEYVPSPTGTMTLTASVSQSSNFYQATKNGSASFTVASNATLFTDPVSCEIASGTPLFVRWFMQMGAGNKWPRGYQCFSGVRADNITEGTALTDLTMGGAMSFSSGADYGISGLLGITQTPKLAIACIGDSIMWGQGDDATGLATPTSLTGDGNGNWGWLQRAAFNSNVPCLVLARSGDQASLNLAPNCKKRRLLTGPSGPIVDWVVLMLGVNDATNGQTYTQLKTNLTSIITALHNHGVKVCLCTISPRTTSTDSWATTANQTMSASHGLSDPPNLVNTDLRGGNFYGADMMYDFAAKCESSVGSCIWKAGSVTADGVHPNQALHTSIATDAAVNLIAFMPVI